MRILQSSIFRAICAIIVGILLIKNPDNTVKGITIAIGILFFLSGAISCMVYFSARMKNDAPVVICDANGQPAEYVKPTFPIVGLGSALLGLTLALMPATFITFLMYVLGAILILGGLNQILNLINANKLCRIPWMFWVCPSVTLLTGAFVIIKPMETASLPMIIIGWCSILYGVTECINAFKIRKAMKNLYKQQIQEY